MVIRRNVLKVSELTGTDDKGNEQWSEPMIADNDRVREFGFSAGYGCFREQMLIKTVEGLILSTYDYTKVVKQSEASGNSDADYYKCKTQYGEDLKIYVQDDTAFIYERRSKKAAAQAWFEEIEYDYDPFQGASGQSEDVLVGIEDKVGEGICLQSRFYQGSIDSGSYEKYTLNIPRDFWYDPFDTFYHDAEGNVWSLEFLRMGSREISFYFVRYTNMSDDDCEARQMWTPDEIEVGCSLSFQVYEEGEQPINTDDIWATWLCGGEQDDDFDDSCEE